MTTNVVYALVEHKFIQKDEIVVKVGRTSKPFGQRLSQYPKNSKMIFAIHVLNPHACVEAETALLRYLSGDYPRVKHRLDVGYEYYQLDAGDAGAVFREMADVVFQYVWTGGVDNLDCCTEDLPPIFDVVEREKEREKTVSRMVAKIFENVLRSNTPRSVEVLASLLCPELQRPFRGVTLHPDLLKIVLIEETLADLGFSSPFDTETIIPNMMTVFDAKLKGTQMFSDYANTARLFSHASCGVRDGWDLRKVSKAVKMILNAVGLDMVSVTKRVQVNGKRTQEERNYRLCPQSVCRMLELVKLRLLSTDLTPQLPFLATSCPCTALRAQAVVPLLLSSLSIDLHPLRHAHHVDTTRAQVKGKRTKEERNYRLGPESVSRMLELLKLRLLRTDLTQPPLPFRVTSCPCTAIAAEPLSPLPPAERPGATGGEPPQRSPRGTERVGYRRKAHSSHQTADTLHTTHYTLHTTTHYYTLLHTTV